MAILVQIFLSLKLLVQVWRPPADYNGCLAHFKVLKKHSEQPLLSAAGCHARPDHSAE
jgi:hypothetical protein